MDGWNRLAHSLEGRHARIEAEVDGCKVWYGIIWVALLHFDFGFSVFLGV